MTRRLLHIAAIAACLGALLAPSGARAHGLDPASLALRETRPGVFEVRWRSSALRLPGANVQPALPARCRQVGAASAADATDNRIALTWTVDCGASGLAGSVVGIDDLAAAKIDALLTVERLHGERIQTVLSPRSPSLTIPIQPSDWEVVRGYATLGMDRLLTEPDHLLFLLGLVLLVTASRRLAQTLIAFTVGHSLGLAAAALHTADLPSPPLALLTALSVLALAVELARTVDRPTLLRRVPWMLAMVFGVLHGFGFARDIAEIGVPVDSGPLAIASFNGGIEIGQLAVVAIVVMAALLCRRWWPAVGQRSTRLAAYAMGVLSVFWCFERAAAWLG